MSCMWDSSGWRVGARSWDKFGVVDRGDFCGGQEVDGGVCARRII